jgi:hypothetical protein
LLFLSIPSLNFLHELNLTMPSDDLIGECIGSIRLERRAPVVFFFSAGKYFVVPPYNFDI